MASTSFITANPLGRWWHPMPLTSGIGAVAMVATLKGLGHFEEYSWTVVIIAPLVLDIVVNLVGVGIAACVRLIADKVESRRQHKPPKGSQTPPDEP